MIFEEGLFWVNGDDVCVFEVLSVCKVFCKIFGLGEQNDLCVVNIFYGEVMCVEVFYYEELFGVFELLVFGEFNLCNMFGVLGMVFDEGLDVDICCEGFKQFKCVKKWQEWIGEVEDIVIFDDFVYYLMVVGVIVFVMWECYLDCCIWVIFEVKSNILRCKVFQEDYFGVFEGVDEVILSKLWKKDMLLED